MKGTASVATRMLRKVGLVNGVPRITNVDTGGDILGYTEINVMATTAFSRTKTHKGWFVGDAHIHNGDRIVDKVDGSKYLVMSIKDEYAGGTVAFIDGTLFLVNEICYIQRANNSVDEFGRLMDGQLSTVATDVWVMINPLVIDTMEQVDRVIEKDKIKVAMQSSIDVAMNDRLVTSTGETFKVESFSRAEIAGLNMVHIVPDTR